MAYRYCENCGDPRDAISLSNLAYSVLQCECGKEYFIEEDEKWASVMNYIDKKIGELKP
jgi:hypothetical protein